MLTRCLQRPITEDLVEKMVLLAGPRQVGKTTLAKQVLAGHPGGAYLSWDNRLDRRAIRAAEWPTDASLLVLDELHKQRDWKRWLKGEFDKHRDRLRFLVTGSARLDVYRRGGDSLQGRYHHYRLHPLSCAELAGAGDVRPPEPGGPLAPSSRSPGDTLPLLMRYGGFPEPFLRQSERTLRRWRKERLDRFFREDVRDLEAVRELSAIEQLADLLPERVGSPLSINALRKDLEVSHRAVTHWVDVLARLYHLFLVRPWSGRGTRQLRKMPKAYLWDVTQVADEGRRFENLVALHLLKLCHFLEDRDGHRVELRYVRDFEGREVDFLVLAEGRPWFAVEAKLSDGPASPALGRLGVSCPGLQRFQIALEGRRDRLDEGIRHMPAARLLHGLV